MKIDLDLKDGNPWIYHSLNSWLLLCAFFYVSRVSWCAFLNYSFVEIFLHTDCTDNSFPHYGKTGCVCAHSQRFEISYYNIHTSFHPCGFSLCVHVGCFQFDLIHHNMDNHKASHLGEYFEYAFVSWHCLKMISHKIDICPIVLLYEFLGVCSTVLDSY